MISTARRQATIEKDGKRVTTRAHVEGQVGRVFQAAGIALPANWRERPALTHHPPKCRGDPRKRRPNP
ncbi:MAG: hypothetical protein OXQ84_15490 [bacterium]|nr:hypothetical protein [bacterium]